MDAKEELPPGTLKIGEIHPTSQSAMAYIQGLGVMKLCQYLESYNSCAIDGNRAAEVCGETLRRVLANEPLSDRYLLGLAWSLLIMEGAVKNDRNKRSESTKWN